MLNKMLLGQPNIVWTYGFGGTGTDYAMHTLETQDGNFIICGYTTSYGSGSNDALLIKVDEDGNQLWYRTFVEQIVIQDNLYNKLPIMDL